MKIQRGHRAASGKMLGGLLIHLNGGRIETRFHIFGSPAFVLKNLRQRQEDDEPDLVVELIEHFLCETQTRTSPGGETVWDSSGAARYRARSLDRNSANSRVRRMAEICAALEKALKSKNRDEFGKGISRLESEFSVVCELLESEGKIITR